MATTHRCDHSTMCVNRKMIVYLAVLLSVQTLPISSKPQRLLRTAIGAIFANIENRESIDEQMFEESIKITNTTNRLNDMEQKYSQLYQFKNYAFLSNTENVDFQNSYQVSNAICTQLSAAGVTSVFSVAPGKAAEAILRSFSEKFQVPYISASYHFLNPTTNPNDPNVQQQAQASFGSSAMTSSDDAGVPISSSVNNDNKQLPAYKYSVSIRPKYIDIVLGLRKQLGWKKLTYIVDGDEGITRIKELLRSQEATEFELLLRQMDPSKNRTVENMLRNISSLGETNIMIDCSVFGTMVFFDIAFELQMVLPSYNYVVINLAASIAMISPNQLYMKYTKGGGNITGLHVTSDSGTLLNYYMRKKPYKSMKEFSTMLTSDAVDLLKYAWKSLLESDDLPAVVEQYGEDKAEVGMGNTVFVGDKKDCGGANDQESNLLGQTLIKHIKKTAFIGMTGRVQFNERGERVNVGIDLVQMAQSEKYTKIAQWNETTGEFVIGDDRFQSRDKKKKNGNNHIIITSILEAPFLVLKDNIKEDGLTGNDIYEGYCVSLIELLAKDLQFTYEIRQVKDGQYGGEVKKANETADGKPVWNGMIGEVMRGEADLAIAPLTINADRQRVVAFSKPFMNIGISIMIKKPQKELPGPLSFLDPFSNEIWYGIIIAYCGLSLGLFIVARFSPTEWQDIPGRTPAGGGFPFPSGPAPPSALQGIDTAPLTHGSSGGAIEKTNDFSLYNSMWFSLGALMQQGTDIAPRAPASRIVGGVWWFFTLIIISSYTANLAAFLTVETMIMPINNADELSDQTEIAYGTRQSGSTMSFFKNSQIKTFERMWDFMSANFAEVMVADNIQGIERVRESNSKYAFLIESAMNEFIAQQKPCDTMKVGPNLDSKGYGIAAEYDSAIIKNITLRILQYQEEGELARLRQMWWIDKGECGGSFSSTNTENTNSLGLSSVAGIFYILISGLVLAMVSAVSEYLYKAYKLHRSQKKSGNGSFKPNVRYMVTATDSMYRPPNGHPVLGGVPAPGAVGPHGVIGFNSLPMAPGAMIETQLLQGVPPPMPGIGSEFGTEYAPTEYWSKESGNSPQTTQQPSLRATPSLM
ncbi:glutamate receptor 2-like isoform X2 [Convolutriloba macropyga]|uniref:glutamate receptor 2-like isoform X2 n=1 Tax=Convolutriloba macropyga TaxID=536237 RepID=UPI003F51BBE9